MSDFEIFKSNLIKLRTQFNLNKCDVETLAGFSLNKYLRIEKGEQEATLSDLEKISAVYNLKAFQIINPQLKTPKISLLPQNTKDIIKQNSNVPTIRKQGKWNLNDHIIVVLSKYRIGDTFANSEIVQQFEEPLSSHMSGKSIEWDKGTLKGLVVEADIPNTNSDNRTKPEKVYKLTKEITPELCEKAQEKIYKTSISSKSEE